MSHENDKLKFGAPADAIVMECPADVNPDDDSVRYYGGLLVCESASAAWRRRIVACVNGAVGIPTEVLEADGPGAINAASKLPMAKKRAEAFRLQALELREQRDELMAALKDAEFIVDWAAEPHQDNVDLMNAAKSKLPKIRAALTIGSKCNTHDLLPGEEDETSAPAIVFYPSGSLGEEIESEGGKA